MIIKLDDYVLTNNEEIKFANLFSELLCDLIDYAVNDKLSYLIGLFSDIGGPTEFASFVYNYNKLTTHIYIYIKSNVIIGFIMCRIDDNICTIGYLAVDENHRNSGIGSDLIKHVITSNIDFNNVEKFCLLVSVNNTNAFKLYLKFGFSIVEIMENAYIDEKCGIYTNDGVHAYKMELIKSHLF